ncbi:MAG: hypothetical protein JSW14_06500 [Candidatus Bathyarchaeum sp.]|nr:MAG: hypothetical protein JSW14_06500 [Candidatus Bathyarchaeum sp.]
MVHKVSGMILALLLANILSCVIINSVFIVPTKSDQVDPAKIFNLGMIIHDLNDTGRQECMNWISQFDPFTKWNFILWEPFENLNDTTFINFLKTRGLLLGATGYMQYQPLNTRESNIDAIIDNFNAKNITLKGMFMFQPDTYTLNYLYAQYGFEYYVGYCFEQYVLDYMTMKGGWQLPYYHNSEHALKPAEDNQGLVVFPHETWDWVSSLTSSHHLYTHILGAYRQFNDNSSQAVDYCLRLINESLSSSEPFGYACTMFEWELIKNDLDLIETTTLYYQQIINQHNPICQLYNETTSWFKQNYDKTPTYQVAFTSPYNDEQIEWYLDLNYRIARVENRVKSYVIFEDQKEYWLNQVCNVDFGELANETNCIDNSLEFEIDDLGGGFERDSPKGGSIYYTGNLADFYSFNPVSQLMVVIEAAENQVYYIYADPHRMTRAVAAYDATSGSIVYGMCQNIQNQGFDTNPNYVSQNESDRGRLLLQKQTVLMFGGPRPNWCVSYLEEQRLTPIYFVEEQQTDGTHFKFVENSTGTDKLDRLVSSIDFEHEDYFVVMSLVDHNSNRVFISYGFDWKGTWSAGIYIKAIYSNIHTYTNLYYIFRWVDSNADGTPQPNEVVQIATG